MKNAQCKLEVMIGNSGSKYPNFKIVSLQKFLNKDVTD